MNRREFNQFVSAFPFLAGIAASTQLLSASEKETYSKPLSKEPYQVAVKTRPNNPWMEKSTRTIEHLKDYRPKKDRTLGACLGIPSDKTKKTGFWHVEKHDGRFWLVDPEGNLNIHRAVCTIRPGGGDQQKKAFAEKFKTKENWAEETVSMLHEHGCNGFGCACDWRTLQESPAHQKYPMGNTMIIGMMSPYGKDRSVVAPRGGHRSYPNDAIFVFEPEFEKYCDRRAAEVVAPLKDDPNLLGYYTDNELPFKMNALEGFLTLPKPDDPGRKAAEAWLAKRNKTKEQIEERDRWEFLGYLGDYYSSITAKAIRKYDPNHLILGPRLYGEARSRIQLLKGIARHIDIISFNYYGVWTPLEEHTKTWTEQTGKPFMVTEWYVKGEDSGLGNDSGAGWIVKTQKDRGLFFQNYSLALIECRNCVGWHWFRYQDNDPTQKNADPSDIDANKGIVDNNYELYCELTERMKAINTQVFDLIEYFDS